jgi:hypothetical protein
MLKSDTAKSIAAIAVAAVVAGVATLLTAGVPDAKAEPQADAALHQPYAKNDVIRALAKGTECSSRGWPHYEQSCLFDLRGAANEARTVRVIVVR